ncbi:hypothetical protein DFH09DRAFT_1092331 [Mycena vulgaris]|nr:hypothetical protein DFH09DRAFT_1092331 [Mycena vulgaris]
MARLFFTSARSHLILLPFLTIQLFVSGTQAFHCNDHDHDHDNAFDCDADKDPATRQRDHIIGASIAGVFLVLVTVAYFIYAYRKRRIRAKQNPGYPFAGAPVTFAPLRVRRCPPLQRTGMLKGMGMGIVRPVDPGAAILDFLSSFSPHERIWTATYNCDSLDPSRGQSPQKTGMTGMRDLSNSSSMKHSSAVKRRIIWRRDLRQDNGVMVKCSRNWRHGWWSPRRFHVPPMNTVQLIVPPSSWPVQGKCPEVASCSSPPPLRNAASGLSRHQQPVSSRSTLALVPRHFCTPSTTSFLLHFILYTSERYSICYLQNLLYGYRITDPFKNLRAGHLPLPQRSPSRVLKKMET